MNKIKLNQIIIKEPQGKAEKSYITQKIITTKNSMKEMFENDRLYNQKNPV